MGNDNSNNGYIELWGRDFKRVKDGLDEEQIVSFVNELINERDTLLQRQEHLSSLSMLAERTIAEADDLARQVKEEAKEKAETEANDIVTKAEEQAQQVLKDTQAEAYDIVTKAEEKAQQILEETKNEANDIMNKAEEQAQQVFEEKKAEAVNIANEEAEAIRANAQKEVALLREKETKRIQSELRNASHQLYGELLSQLDSFKQQVTEMGLNLEQVLSQPEQVNPVSTEEETHVITLYDDWEAESEVPDSTVIDHESSNYEGEVELEIQPPIEMRKIMGIISYLESLAEVRTTELIPLADKPIIKAFLRESIHLIEMLRALPEVGQAIEVPEDAESEQRTIQITLTENSVLDESEKALNDQIFNILSQ